ncbi:MAG: ATP-binding protein [Chloroflexota bacterium]|nr:ATP-binding protein [Chloroflexota bacterium]
MSTSTTQTMRTHPELIYSIIHKQAGSRSKALQEAAQNSIDAGATRFDVTVTSKGFVALDDGRGFASREDIDSYFLTFGTPHKEGDSTYGRFRIGRGQIFAFASTVWRTNTFAMAVDIKNKGLDVRVDENLPFESGCRIEGEWYEPLLPSDLYKLERELADLFTYAAIPMFINGKLVNKAPETEEWDVVSDDAYIKFKDSGGLMLYNLGFFVRNYGGYKHGNAIVVTKQHLELNMARNDVIESSCKVWRRITKVLNEHVRRNATQSPKMTEDVRQNMAQRWRFGEIDYSEMYALKLFTDTQGAHHTLERLSNANVVVVAPKGDRVAETVHRRKIAFVLADVTLTRFGISTLEQLFSLLRELVTRDGYRRLAIQLADVHISTLEAVSEGLQSGYILHPDGEITLEERLLLSALNRHQRQLAYILENTEAFRETVRARTIRAGTSATALGWTDGSTYVAIERRVLKLAISRGYPGMIQLVMLLLHEYVHDVSDQASHEHDHQFYETFHNAATWGLEGNLGLFDVARTVFDAYQRKLRKAGKVPSQKALLDQDRMVRSGPAPMALDDDDLLDAAG